MSDQFQLNELIGVVEHDPRQCLAVDLAFEDDVRPSLGYSRKSLGAEDQMPDRVRIDGANSMIGQ